MQTFEGPFEPHSTRSDLGSILREEGPLGAERVIRIVRGVAAALDGEHEAGRVHGNVRPDNILVDPGSDDVWLRGFSSTDNESGEQTVGVPDYAAPERIQGRIVDRRADVYSLGCVAYHCLTNAKPYPRATEGAVINAHLYDPPPKVSGRGIPGAVNGVIARALDKRPENRYPTCAELANDLEAALTRPRRWSPKRKGLAVAAAALVALVLTAIVVIPPLVRDDGSAAYPTAEEMALRDLVELSGCRRSAPDGQTGFHNVVAAIECTPAGTGASTVFYYRFATLDDLRLTFDDHARRVNAPAETYCAGDTPPSGFLGNKRHDLRSVEIGGLLCHAGPQSTLVIEWSVEQLRLLGRAIGTDPKKLSQWWVDQRGPSSAKIAEAINAESSPPFPSDMDRALLDRLPRNSHGDCTRVPESQRKTNAPAAVAGVVCGARGASIVFYYQFPDNASMVANYRSSGEPQGPDCTTVPADFRGEGPYSHDGASGRLFCATNDGGGRFLTWTNDQLNIQAFAFAVAEPGILFDWWRNEAGPR